MWIFFTKDVGMSGGSKDKPAAKVQFNFRMTPEVRQHLTKLSRDTLLEPQVLMMAGLVAYECLAPGLQEPIQRWARAIGKREIEWEDLMRSLEKWRKGNLDQRTLRAVLATLGEVARSSEKERRQA